MDECIVPYGYECGMRAIAKQREYVTFVRTPSSRALPYKAVRILFFSVIAALILTDTRASLCLISILLIRGCCVIVGFGKNGKLNNGK